MAEKYALVEEDGDPTFYFDIGSKTDMEASARVLNFMCPDCKPLVVVPVPSSKKAPGEARKQSQ